MAEILFNYDSARDILTPSSVIQAHQTWGKMQADASGEGIGNWRVFVLDGVSFDDLRRLNAPSVDEMVTRDLEPTRRRLERFWWVWPVDNLPNRIRSAVRNGTSAGRRVELVRADVLSWVVENPKVAEHLVNLRTLWPPIYEPPTGKTRTQV